VIGLYESLTLKINRVPDSPKDKVCTKFSQNPLKDVDSRVFTRMLCGKKLIFKVKGQGHWVNVLPCNILVNTLESTSFNGF
jgi:hypothetical protein